ncbi:MAG TPA: hypothetical protein VK876_01815, partial [Rubrivivax sp.]|nr:hypothetical protein [Rubrivivax sp.]
MVAAHLVRMRSAQFALQFPHQVGELAACGHPRQQRRIALVHAGPVHARHIFHPEVVALQPPYLAQHLLPFLRRLHP